MAYSRNNIGTLVVIDLETLGTKERSIILSAGLVALDPLTLEEIGALYLVFEKDCPLNRKRVSTAATIEWWEARKQKHPKAYDAVFGEDVERVKLRTGLKEIVKFVMRHNTGDAPTHIFGNGPEFDCSIIDDAFEQAGIEVPWKFRNQQSVRTARLFQQLTKSSPEVEVDFEGTRHHAFWDAKYEANILRTTLGFPPVYTKTDAGDCKWTTLF